MKQKPHYQLLTKAAEQGKHIDGWNVYPRPQMKREGYQILKNGWTLNGQSIRVPFPPQSALSDYADVVGDELTYETTFSIPEEFVKERVLLHFGAVDQVAKVYVNDTLVGEHEGGYLPFSFDITEVAKRDGENRLVVKVVDTLSHIYPYGKQREKRGGMWYTPVSGIWQNVWIENVPEKDIKKIVITPDMEGIKLFVDTEGATRIIIALEDRESFEAEIVGRQEFYLNLADHICRDGNRYVPQLWTVENPHLYSMKIVTQWDEVETYFALRTIAICEIDGVKRVCLNDKPIFFHGVLDQGYYCDGIFLPAEPEEYERDILRMKELGFNMLRKHIKIEPECFYYYCDKHGMLVIQDMVSSGEYSFIRDTALPTIGMKNRSDRGGKEDKRKEVFREHTKGTIEHLYNHPCIVAYTIFNEGWGQFDSDAMYDFVKELDHTRLIDSTSGWFAQEKNDFDSEHIYFKVKELEVKNRPLFVSECGGYSRVVEGHHYSKGKVYGYGKAADEDALTEMIVNMYEKMILPAIEDGVCGCIYTQLSDVEDEVNGFYTYDRKVCKVNKKAMQELAKKLVVKDCM